MQIDLKLIRLTFITYETNFYEYQTGKLFKNGIGFYDYTYIFSALICNILFTIRHHNI